MNRTRISIFVFASTFLCAIAFNASLSVADMKKTAPALKTTASSKAEPHNNEGIEHYNQQHWDVAKKHFTEAVKADPSSAEAHYNLALAFRANGDADRASEAARKACSLDTRFCGKG